MNYSNRLGIPIYLSERVNELLNEGTLTELFNLIDADIKDEWTQKPLQADRDSLYHEIQALSRVRTKIETLVNNLRLQGSI